MKKVLVTGGSSYIGKHCISQLLEKGYKVRTTLRDLKKADEIKYDLKKFLNKEFEIEFFEADLIEDKVGMKPLMDVMQYSTLQVLSHLRLK